MAIIPVLSRSFLSFSLSAVRSGGGGGGTCGGGAGGVVASLSTRSVSGAGAGSSLTVPFVFTSRQETGENIIQ